MNYDKKYLAQLKETYFTAKALKETIIEQVNNIKNLVLSVNAYYAKNKRLTRRSLANNEQITSYKHDYMMSEKDFSDYLSECYKEYQKQNIAHPQGKEYCPDYPYTELRQQAETTLIDYGLKILPIEQQEILKYSARHITHRQKILDLILCLET